MSSEKYKLLYFVSEDEYFISHKIEQVRDALKKNIDVLVVTKFKKKEKQILDAGFKTKHINFDRKSINPIKEFLCILKLVTIIFKFKPNIIQANALKPILYISLISNFLSKKTKIILCVVGLGYLFIKKSRKNFFIKNIYIYLMKFTLRKQNSIFVFQNNEDKAFFLKKKLLRNTSYKVIKGSGVDIEKFCSKKVKKIYDIIFHSRLLYDKGFNEIVEALSILRKKKIYPKILILGDPDESNRSSVDKSIIISMVQKKICLWINKVDNVIPYLQKSKISVLPSYREGLPKSLLEAASCKLPLVATNVPGCRDICKNNFNGILVPKKNSKFLSKAIEKLLKNKALMSKYGENGRKLVKQQFSLKIITHQFMKIYLDAC
ncbi:MAG: glycosyltransferase family 4 protein [Alphaproteobacteria bacterium]